MHAVSTVNLSKFYKLGDVEVHSLKGINLAVENNTMCCIMGKSGAGKSTLLRQLGLLDVPTSGRVLLQDSDTSHLSEADRAHLRLSQLGYIFQEYALIPELTSLENIMLPGLQLSYSKPGIIRQRAKELLALVSLGDRGNHLPRQLSGGEQQRVAIARSLINNPHTIFADEPTANLDTVSTIMIMYLLEKLNKESGVTVVFVSHDPDQHNYARQLVNIQDGRISELRI